MHVAPSLLAAVVFAGILTAPAPAQSPRCDEGNAGLQLPAGFCALLVDSVPQVRHIAIAPNGDLFAAARNRGNSRGGLFLLRDTDGDGAADERHQLADNGGTGVWLTNNHVYFAPDDAVLRYAYTPGMTSASTPDTIVRALPVGGHSAKTIAVTPDGALFVNIGSRTNSCQEDDRQPGSPGIDPCTELETRAGIWRFDAGRRNQTQADGTRHATGLRNVVALTLHPVTNELWGAQHGRDQFLQNWGALYDAEASAELPSEEFMRIAAGTDFGWPYCYHDHRLGRRVLAPEYGGDARTAGRCADRDLPAAPFPGHWAPNAVAFYTARQFPAAYRGGVFIAFHGSWNRNPLPQQGYNVVFQPMADGRASGDYEVFAEGFREIGARPTGLAVGPDGSLYISDDTTGRIWRVIRR